MAHWTEPLWVLLKTQNNDKAAVAKKEWIDAGHKTDFS
jgi:hypothetical protein